MNIKRLFEKTSTGLKEFVAKVDFANVIGLNEELSKYVKRNSNEYVAEINPDINFDGDVPVINFIYGDGSSKDINLDLASEEFPGLMTRDDKIKLNNLPNLSNPTILTDVGNYGRSASFIDLVYKSTSTQTPYPKIRIEAATTTYAGVMTAADKVKLDDIENTYLPLSGGTLTGVLRLNNINSDQNGLDINNVNGIQSVDQDKILTPEAWTTNGGSINLLNLLSNAAIYVYGDIIDSTEGNFNTTDIIDYPDSIVFDKWAISFFARKNGNYYSHWTCNSEVNIFNPDRYGIVDNDHDIVKPFAKQMYKFTNSDNIYVFNHNNGNMEPLTFN